MLNIQYDEDTILKKRALLRQRLQELLPCFKNGNFETLSGADLEVLFRLYDEIFFQDFFKSHYSGRFRFTCSRQLVRSAGLTRYARNFHELPPEKRLIEIKISLNHLAAFDVSPREKLVAGIVAADRLDALLLIFEHELCHAAEFLLYGETRCGGKRFKAMASCIFGHKSSHHELPSRAEVVSSCFGLNAGDRVRFEYNGCLLSGVIVRVNKRATVLAETKKGRFVDSLGNRYAKYLVPFDLLKKVEVK